MSYRHCAVLFLIGAIQAVCAAWCLFCLMGAATAWFTDLLAGDGEQWTRRDAVLMVLIFFGFMVPAVIIAGVAARHARNIRSRYAPGPRGFEVVGQR